MVDKGSSSVNGAADVQPTSTMQPQYKVACDERCPVVHGLAALLHKWETGKALVLTFCISLQKEPTKLSYD